MAKLSGHRYGKARVRVMKILRETEWHTLKDIEVAVLLRGDFTSSYISGDNTKVVATDTMKNTINVLAKQHLGEEIERFALIAGEHFLERYQQVETVEIEIAERSWKRMEVDGKAHPHSFEADGDARMFTRAVCRRSTQTIESGIRDLLILKTTGSGFENYPKDEFTTLPETADRILATSLQATWSYSKQPGSYRGQNDKIIAAMLKVFANNYSPSAQTSLF